MPSTIAIAARYWMNTTGAALPNSKGCFMHTEKTREPAGETQTLDPRPRPATWVVAVNVKPGGSLDRSLVFLGIVNIILVDR